MEVTFRFFTKNDWQAIVAIYKQGIETKNATFTKEIPSWDSWNSVHLMHSRIVAIKDNKIIGWAALSSVSTRAVYSGIAEVSVYIDSNCIGQKTGTKLLEKLITESEKNNIWTLQASIFPENKASLKIHANLGFRTIGYREKVAQMDGVWRNTIIIEKRSKIIG